MEVLLEGCLLLAVLHRRPHEQADDKEGGQGAKTARMIVAVMSM
jgi:hypothetical protein